MSDAGTSDPGPARSWSDDRAQEALVHLQAAALEFIEAARAVLDVAEEVVREPGGVASVVAETVGGLAEAFAQVAPAFAERGRAAAGRPRPAGTASPGDSSAEPRPGTGKGRRGGVEHIRIS